MGIKAKKSYGQHFLTDENIAARIAATVLDHTPSGGTILPIVEIGPGTGALTRHLLGKGRELLCIEVDPEAAGYMRRTYPDAPLLETDFLFADINTIFPGRQIALIGNYPYNISTQIFFRVLDYRDKIQVCAGMLQREVAQRICSREGNRSYGILSVLLQLWYDCEYLFTVDETVFRPMPRVKSGVLRLTRNTRTSLPCSGKLLKEVVKTSFGQRRKTLRNSLSGIISRLPHGASTTGLGPFLPQRPEQLSPEQFLTLTTLIEQSMS